KSAKERNKVQYPDPDQWQVIDESAEEAAEDFLSMEQLQAMIQQLPPTSRQVFNLYAIDGFRHAEIAEGLAISIGTSKWHLAEARKRLQKMVREQLGTSSYYKSKTS
ncbi:MAG: sigma-70 family RNA polymerase sigma factor, partial [Bacteroidota bacterium]